MPEKTLAMYIRLSVEDGDLRSSTDKSESNSVTNQRKILQSYIEQTHDLLSYRITEFCDDGYSGTSFERPNFKRMMELVRRGDLHCIIVKDDCVIIEPTQKDLENQGFVAGSICF